MAITKINNIGGGKNGARHLVRAIKYIMNPAKTADGLWVGGNCGNTAEECYFSMMQTKEDWNKTDGRQGYHIVLSFPPGEGDEKTIFAIAKEFCEEYLGNGYEYVFSVHNDQPHLHAHIVFNSVNRLTGVKYHYNNGDWEKFMQPVTDRICEKYGLSQLVYEKDRIGRSYAEHLANEENRPTWEKIIKGDIDFAVARSQDLTGFRECMVSLGYEIKTGHSEKHGDYITYVAPGEGDPRHRSKRDYRMGAGYTLGDIVKRFGEEVPNEQRDPKRKGVSDILISRPGRPLSRFQVMATYRLQRLDDFRFLDLDLQEQVRVREDLLKIDKLREEVDMILERDLGSKTDCEKEMDRIRSEIRNLDKDDPGIQELRKDKNILRRILNGFKEYEEVKEAPIYTPDGDDRTRSDNPSEELRSDSLVEGTPHPDGDDLMRSDNNLVGDATDGNIPSGEDLTEDLEDPEDIDEPEPIGPVLRNSLRNIRRENYDG